jgi:malate synthase
MSQTTTVLQASQALEDDHHRLHTLIDRLRVGLDLAGMATALTELHGALSSHFNAEERPGGLYDALGVCIPEFRERLGELVDDHFRFSGLVRDLAQRAREAEGAAADALRADVARFMQALADHERREHEMVKAAVERTA